MCVAKQTVAIW